MINELKPDYSHTPANPLSEGFGYSLSDTSALPLVSIVTPFFNTREEFHETARCVLGQSFQQFEWIIVNDGTNDPQAESILSEYRNKDSRIRVIDHPKNLGLSAARNTGFIQARCEYVILVDSDDLLEPSAAEKWWWYLITHPQAGFVASYHVAFGSKNYLWTGGFHDGAMNAQRNRVSMMCMIRKSVHTAVGGFDELIRGGLEDWEFWMRCAAKGIWGATIPKFLAWYRIRDEHTDRWQNLTEQRIEEFRKGFERKYPGLYSGQFPNLVEKVDLDLTQIDLVEMQANCLKKTKPHLLLILPWLVMGGAERFALNLIDQLILKGWKVSIVTTALSENAWESEFEKRTEDVFILSDFLPIKDYPRFVGSFISSRSIDVVMLQGSIEGYRLLPVIRDMHPELPILDYLHFVTPDWMDGGFPRLSYLYRDSINLTITSCQQVKDWMVTQSADETCLRVCPIGVDSTIWKPDSAARERVRKEMGISPDEVVLIFAARLEAQKQPLVFAETLRLLNKQGVPFKALIAGDGSLRLDLERKLSQDQIIERVKLLGAVKSEDMPALLAAADLFFLPSQNEGISSAVFEAMAVGLPVVGANVGGQAELVTPECGILLPSTPENEQPGIYANTLRLLIEDATRRQYMGIASRKRICSGFTLEHMSSQMVNILSEAIKFKREGRLTYTSLPPAELAERDTRHVLEYLQARQEWRNVNDRYLHLINQFTSLSDKYFDLLQPKPSSYWFYLWLRQVFLPLYNLLDRSRFKQFVSVVQKWVKNLWIQE